MDKNLLHQLLKPIFADLNLVTNEELQVQKKVLVKTRHKLEELEKKLSSLEEKLKDASHTKIV